MSRLFATPDIVTLVAAFPLPSPLREHPSLVRSAAGDTLISSRKVIQDFRELLATCPERLRLSDLPRKLGILKTDWLFNCYDGQIYFNRDRQSILPTPVAQSTWNSIKAQTTAKPLTISELVTREDIALESLDKLVLLHDPHSDAVRFFDDGSRRYLYATDLVKEVSSHIADAEPGDSQGIDLTMFYAEVSPGLLKHLGNEALKQTGRSGKFETQSDTVCYIPANNTAGLEAKRKAVYDQAVAELVTQFSQDGFCRVPVSTEPAEHAKEHGLRSILNEVRAALSSDAASSITELPIENEGTTVVVTGDKLNEGMESLRCAALPGATNVWHHRDGSESVAMLIQRVFSFVEEKTDRTFLLTLLTTSRAAELEPLITDKFAKLEREDVETFESIVTERLLCPAQLYMDGISTAADPVLKEHLEEYIGHYFRRDIVPSILQSLQENRLLINKSRKRDIEKMQQAISDAKSLTGVHAALSKLARKQKVDLPTSEQLHQLKQQTLQQMLKAMMRMTRGSDLLQNLLWMLLASRGPGLYISSGKDTTRMIKRYQSIGDADVAQKLVKLRDKLKAGQESGDDLEMMMGMATKAVENADGA